MFIESCKRGSRANANIDFSNKQNSAKNRSYNEHVAVVTDGMI